MPYPASRKKPHWPPQVTLINGLNIDEIDEEMKDCMLSVAK